MSSRPMAESCSSLLARYFGQVLDDGNVLRPAGEMQAFLEATVAAADHQHVFAFVEGPIAHRAVVDGRADQARFAGDVQQAVA